MAESLGDALLSLRTDDSQFNAGIGRAEGRARQLDGTLDKTRTTTRQLGTTMNAAAGSADRLSEAMVRQRARGRENVTSLGAQRAGMQQLSFQLNDVATMYALGARPMQIFASQSGQVIQAVQMMTGGASSLARFLGGPWGIALTSAVVVLAPFIGKLFEAEDALESVELAADRMGDAQSILGRVIDTTTGKIDRQAGSLLALARAQAIVGQKEARAQLREATGRLNAIRAEETQVFASGVGGVGPAMQTVRNPVGEVVAAFRNGEIGQSAAIARLYGLVGRGGANDPAMQAIAAISDSVVAAANEGYFNDTLDALSGDQEALQRLGFGGGGEGSRSGGTGRSAGSRITRDQAEIETRVNGDLIAVGMQILRARQQVATSAEERAELQRRQVEWDRRIALDKIAADTELSEAQKAELSAAETRLADAEIAAIEFAKRTELERDAQAMADERFTSESEALQIQLELADTEAERKAIALRMLEAEEAYLRSRLMAVIFSDTANEAERQRAEVALEAIRSTSADRRAATARANETTIERYLREVNQTPAQINEALDGITMDGLDSLNAGLADAIMGANTLGDVFSRVADQIIADLLRIAIQQTIIRPLAEGLFGGGGGGGGGLLSAFAGFFADGGRIATGQFGVVGENGPELAFAGPGGVDIVSNSDSRKMMEGAGGGGVNVSIPISIDATGADAAALSRTNAELQRLRQQLPGLIIRTVQDADDRRIVQLGGR